LKTETKLIVESQDYELGGAMQTHVRAFAKHILKYFGGMRSRAILLLFTLFIATRLHAGDLGFPIKTDAKVVVLVFISSECPISNKFAPELERLSYEFSTNDVSFNLVYPNASDTDSKIADHRRDFHLSAPFLRDQKHTLVKIAGATVTPEAAVFDAQRKLAYRGRVNDQYLALGKGRPEPTQHDLEDAISAVLAGHKPKHARIEAIGCYIQD
jgi:thiol-disulfide isomerase/thioredoxin